MSRQRMPDIFSKTPDGFHVRMKTTLNELEKGQTDMKKRYKFTAALACALALVMLLSAVALAAANGKDLIGWLFGDGVPRGMVEQALSKPDAVQEKDGLKLSIDECLYDGNTFSFSITAESNRDETVFFGTYLPVLEPELQPSTGGFGVGTMELVALGGEAGGKPIENKFNTFAGYHVPTEMVGKPIKLTLSGQFYTPKKPIVAVAEDHGDYDLYPEDKDNIYLQYGLYTYFNNYPAGREIVETSTPEIQDLLDVCHMQPLDEITLTLTVEPNTAALRHTKVDGPTVFEYPEYTLTVTKADFGTASTTIEYNVVTKPGATRGNVDVGPPTLAFELLDQNGKLIEMSWSGGSDTFDDGTARMEWSSRGDPLEQPPEQVTLMPYNQAAYYEGGGDLSQYFYSDEAVQLKIVPD